MNQCCVKLPNGDKLVAEVNDYQPYNIAVGIVNREGIWIQDLVVIEPDGYENQDGDSYSLYVFSDNTTEDWQKKYTIERIRSDAT